MSPRENKPATKRELVARWSQEPGKSILEQIHKLCFQLQMPGHGHTSQEIYAMLNGLPLREEVPNGRDLRGAALGGGVHELDFSECDFSFARIQMNFVNCNLSRAKFDEANIGGNTILKQLNGASFRKASLRSCFFQNAQAQGCNFESAVLTGASFEGADLTGSSFQEANCKRAKFLRANLIACNFQRAQLDEAVFQEVTLDKTTDLRGASLTNLYDKDHRDIAGNLVARGTDWHLATHDEAAQTNEDPAAQPIELLDAAISQAQRQGHSAFQTALQQTRDDLRSNYRDSWYDELIGRVTPSQRPELEALLSDAMRSLL